MKHIYQYLAVLSLPFCWLCSPLCSQTIGWQHVDVPDTQVSVDVVATIKNTLTESCYVMISQEQYIKRNLLGESVLTKLATRYNGNRLNMYLDETNTRPSSDTINSLPETFVKILKPRETFEVVVATTRSQSMEVQNELSRRLLVAPASEVVRVAPNFEKSMRRNHFIYDGTKISVFWGDLNERFRSMKYGHEDFYDWQKRLRQPLVITAEVASSPVVPRTDCDVPPLYPGGEEKLTEYFLEQIRELNYTNESNSANRVTLTFVVEVDGTVSDIQVQKSNSGDLSKIVVRIAEGMSLWQPAQWRGRTVRSRYVLPITYM